MLWSLFWMDYFLPEASYVLPSKLTIEGANQFGALSWGSSLKEESRPHSRYQGTLEL